MDPREQYPKPELNGGDLEPPGLTSQMPDRPDHGEQTYRGSGRLAGERPEGAGPGPKIHVDPRIG